MAVGVLLQDLSPHFCCSGISILNTDALLIRSHSPSTSSHSLTSRESTPPETCGVCWSSMACKSFSLASCSPLGCQVDVLVSKVCECAVNISAVDPGPVNSILHCVYTWVHMHMEMLRFSNCCFSSMHWSKSFRSVTVKSQQLYENNV